MTRVVSLYFPTWPTDRLRRAMGQSPPSAETPVVMFGRQGNRRLVLAADAAGCGRGARLGLAFTTGGLACAGVGGCSADGELACAPVAKSIQPKQTDRVRMRKMIMRGAG